MVDQPKFEAFTFSPDDPMAEEHAAVSAWVEEASGALDTGSHHGTLELKHLASGRRLLDGDPGPSRRYVLAAIAQAGHWHDRALKFLGRAPNPTARLALYENPELSSLELRRDLAVTAVAALMRRNLRFTREDLLTSMRWGLATKWEIPLYASADVVERFYAVPCSWLPVGPIAKELERYASATPLDAELLEATRAFLDAIPDPYRDKPAARVRSIVEGVLVGAQDQAPADAVPAADFRPPPRPAQAGTPGVLETLKHLYGMRPDRPPPGEVIGLDHFPLGEDSPLRRQHELLGALIEEQDRAARSEKKSWPDEMAEVKHFETSHAICEQEPLALGDTLLAMAERRTHAILFSSPIAPEAFTRPRGAFDWFRSVPVSGAEVRPDRLFDMLLALAAGQYWGSGPAIARLIQDADRHAAEFPPTEGERYVLWLLRATWVNEGTSLGLPPWGFEIMTRLIGDGAGFFLVPGQAWTEAVNADLGRLKPARQVRWRELLRHALSATAARPSSKWLATARKLVEAVGTGEVAEAFRRWLPLVARGRTIPILADHPGGRIDPKDEMPDEVAICLRGLVWMIQVLPSPGEWARALTSVALGGYKKIPEVDSRAIKVGNAAVYALSELGTTDAVGQLALLKVRVSSGPAQKEIERAFAASAEALGLTRDQIEEMGVPSYGLEEVGIGRESFGDHRAELIVDGSDAELRWFDAAGKQLKSVPARVKADHKDDLKELQQSLKDIQAMLPAQRDRIDGMFLEAKSWPIDAWRERYLDHPLVGTIARRLIWCVDGTPAFFVDGRATDSRGEPIPHGTTAEITLWHPVGRGVDEVLAWRRRLEELGVTQPFKQAHREVYLLTDAERNTATYSNRFAAHIIRQHQFNALCAARGWKHPLSHVSNDTEPATRDLPRWGLHAELWLDVGAMHDPSYNESGILLRLATDQVRFYRRPAPRDAPLAGAGIDETHAPAPPVPPTPPVPNSPVPLEEIPPLVFSEVMRDVDLFVGVASVANDPTWQDGGPGGEYRRYWHGWSFGDLSGTAATRKQVLERLVPRLKIADRCSFADRFLVVRGRKRTYKIHLGSGNILMEPNDQYLCIVQDVQSRAKPDDLFLPFEGDGMLSIILSKAFLLAEDAKIKDPTIARQIDGL